MQVSLHCPVSWFYPDHTHSTPSPYSPISVKIEVVRLAMLLLVDFLLVQNTVPTGGCGYSIPLWHDPHERYSKIHDTVVTCSVVHTCLMFMCLSSILRDTSMSCTTSKGHVVHNKQPEGTKLCTAISPLPPPLPQGCLRWCWPCSDWPPCSLWPCGGPSG